jgi:hypothetical protein
MKAWQKLLGYTSWACTSMRWGRFALQSSYKKIAGKTQKFLQTHLNNEIQSNSRWLIKFFKISNGFKVETKNV